LIRFLLVGVSTVLVVLLLCPSVEAAPAESGSQAIPADLEEYLPFLVGIVVVLGIVALGLALYGKRSEVEQPLTEVEGHEPYLVEKQQPQPVPPANPLPQAAQPVTVLVSVPSTVSPARPNAWRLARQVVLVIAITMPVISVSAIYSVVTGIITSPRSTPTSLESGFIQQAPEENVPQLEPIQPRRTFKVEPPPPKNPGGKPTLRR
jgi:hypothetical protein